MGQGTLKVIYSEAVDVFEIMDNASMWHESSDSGYYKHFKKKFELSDKDQSLLEEYKKLRLKYYRPVAVSENTGLFNNNFDLPLTSFANAFYSSKSIGEALNVLATRTISATEKKFLVTFYKHFQDKITTMVRESAAFRSKIQEVQKVFKKGKVDAVVGKSFKFLNIDKTIKGIKIYPVWYPEDLEPRILNVGTVIILRANPINKWDSVKINELVEKAIELLLVIQSNNQKDNFSKIFLNKCQIKSNIALIDVFSSPLAVVLGKMFFEQNVLKKQFNQYREWSIHPWVNVYSKMLFSLVEKSLKEKETIESSEFVTNAAAICNDLVTLNTFLSIR